MEKLSLDPIFGTFILNPHETPFIQILRQKSNLKNYILRKGKILSIIHVNLNYE